MDYQTVLYDVADHVCTVTLNRPEVLNAFDGRMLEEFEDIWGRVRVDDDIHVVVLRAAGDRAFCTGMDNKDGFPPYYLATNLWSQQDATVSLSPKHHEVWKPMVCAVQGMVAGGAFYWLNDADIIICSEEATFFEPHASYGLVAAAEPRGLARRMPIGEVLRMALMGLDERISAERAMALGFVTEITLRDQLWPRADEIATSIASKPPAAIQGTVRAIWESFDMTRTQALSTAIAYTQLGNALGQAQLDPDRTRPQWRLR